MIVTVSSFKGGVGKTTIAVHLATYLSKKGPTVLVDGDGTRSATGWAKRGKLPFQVVDETKTGKVIKEAAHLVFDTEAGLDPKDLKTLSEASELVIIPTTPDALSLNALMLTLGELQGSNGFRVLLNIIPPKPSRDGEEARNALKQRGVPLMNAQIRRYVAYQKAALAGVPVYEVSDPRAKIAWSDYLKLGREILK